LSNRIVILASGNGSLAQNLIDSELNVVALISDQPNAFALTRAKDAGIDTAVIEMQKNRNVWDEAITARVTELNPDLVVSAGFMRILSPEFVKKFRTINIHPSLLPNFPGAHAVRDALASGATLTGTTIHWVDAGLDTGEIIDAAEVAILANDSQMSLHERIKLVERQLLLKTVKKLITNLEYHV